MMMKLKHIPHVDITASIKNLSGILPNWLLAAGFFLPLQESSWMPC